MSGKILTKKRAADILGLSERSVYRYMQLGRLRVVYEGKMSGIPEEEVYKLKQVLTGPTPSKLDVSMLLARVLTLENKVAVLERIANVHYEPLNLTLPEYRTLHQMAEVFATQGWAPHVEEQWADTLVRLKLEDLEKLEEALEDPHPWRAFLKLASSMHLNCYQTELRPQFAAGKNNVVSIATIWCTLKGESPKTFDLLMERDASPNRKLMKKLAKGRPSS